MSLFSTAVTSNAGNFIGVIGYTQKFSSELDRGDLYHISALFQRCSGVLGAYAKYLPTDMIDIKKQYAVMSITFMETAINALNKKGQNAETGNIKQVEKAVLKLVDLYYEQIEDEQISSGSIMQGDSALDMEVCMSQFK